MAVTEGKSATEAVEKPLPTLRGKHYEALFKAMGNNDAGRPALDGVMVEPDYIAAADGFLLAVVHGQTEITYRPEEDAEEDDEQKLPGIRQFMLNSNWFKNKAVAAMLKSAGSIRIVWKSRSRYQGQMADKSGHLGSVDAVAVDGLIPPDTTFPDWSQILKQTEPVTEPTKKWLESHKAEDFVPETGNGERICVSAHLMKRICDLAIALQTPENDKQTKWGGDPSIILEPIYGANKPYRITINSRDGGPAADVVLMPMVKGL